MRRRAVGLLVSIALGILGAWLTAGAQQAGKVSRIGMLLGRSADPRLEYDAFRQGLRDLGYVEGRDILVERRYAEGKLERLPGLAAELVRLKVDLLVAVGTLGAEAAKNATRTIPIVFIALVDPVRQGFVSSLARPGGNITGFSILPGTEIAGKRLELLKDAVPNVTRVAVLWNPANPAEGLTFRELQSSARALGVTVQSIEVREPKEFANAFAAMRREHADALHVLDGPFSLTHRRQIVVLAEKNRIPAIYGLREFVDAGGLMAHGASLADLFRRAPTYVDKILKGAKPGDLPVELPRKFDLVVNLKAAKTLGLTIPQSVLLRADEVIQ